MKQDDINKTRGHALYLKNILTTALSKCDALIAMADVLESYQVIVINLIILELVCKADEMLVDFDLPSSHDEES